MTSPALDSRSTVTADPPGAWVRAPGRLHLGFLDPAATLGRRFGSLGLVIDGFETHVEISAAAVDAVDGTDALRGPQAEAHAAVQRAAAHLAALRMHTGCHEPLLLRLRRLPPAHAGFGSGTQLALAIGRAFTAWFGLQVPTATLAAWLGRGLRSGVGIAGFDQGGLLLDGGPGTSTSTVSPTTLPAPLLARLPLPEAWRVVLVLDPRQQGLSGADERQALAALAPLPQAAAAELCHQVLMRVLPGAATADFAAFASGLSRVQQVLGEHFAPAQDGRAYASAAVGQAVQWLAAAAGEGGAASGQSSWGPTGFVILPTQLQAEALVAAARAAAVLDPALALHIVPACNRGALQAGSAACRATR